MGSALGPQVLLGDGVLLAVHDDIDGGSTLESEVRERTLCHLFIISILFVR